MKKQRIKTTKQYWDKPGRNKNKLGLNKAQIMMLESLGGKTKKLYLKHLKGAL